MNTFVNQDNLSRRMSTIKHKIVVLSGKGGVGKSTVTAQLALSLAAQGNRVGVLDIDICGPSIPKILGLEGREVHQCSEGWVPVYSDIEKRLGCMSIGFLLKGPDDAVVWRGPKKTAMIRQFVEDVFWDQLDYLIIDTPPGTTDEHISIAEVLMKCNPDGAIIVTTPQGVSLSDVRKEIRFCQTTKIPIIGIVENMSGFACPCCGEITNIFSKGGGEELSKQYSVPFLGAVPLDPQLGTAEDQGEDFVRKYPDSASAKALLQIVNKLLVSVGESPVETITTTTTTTETTTPMSNGDNNNNGN